MELVYRSLYIEYIFLNNAFDTSHHSKKNSLPSNFSFTSFIPLHYGRKGIFTQNEKLSKQFQCKKDSPDLFNKKYHYVYVSVNVGCFLAYFIFRILIPYHRCSSVLRNHMVLAFHSVLSTLFRNSLLLLPHPGIHPVAPT